MIAVAVSNLYAVCALLVLVVGALAAVLRMTVKIVRVVDGQLDAMRENTRAIENLTTRVDALEGTHV